MKRYTQEEISALEKLLQTSKNRVMYRKYLVVHLHMKGYTNLQIADMLGLNKNTVGIYINTYNTQGADGFGFRNRPTYSSQTGGIRPAFWLKLKP